MSNETFKIRAKQNDLYLRVTRGHFATSHSHINYYIDVTIPKSRLSEAQAMARELVSYYNHSTVVDTILCLDGTEVIGTCMADELTEANFVSINAHQTIYVVKPEHTTGSQIIFRDNLIPMIRGKNVLILAASVTTGYTARAAVEAVRYYGGCVAGISAIFSTMEQCMEYPVRSVFDLNDIQDYQSGPSHECPQCKAGLAMDGLINSFGISKL